MMYFQVFIVDLELGKKDDDYQRLQVEIKRLIEDNVKLKVIIVFFNGRLFRFSCACIG